MKLTGAQIVWECLQREGWRLCLVTPEAPAFQFMTLLSDYNIHHVLVRHEQGASHMADGYAPPAARLV